MDMAIFILILLDLALQGGRFWLYRSMKKLTKSAGG